MLPDSLYYGGRFVGLRYVFRMISMPCLFVTDRTEARGGVIPPVSPVGSVAVFASRNRHVTLSSPSIA